MILETTSLFQLEEECRINLYTDASQMGIGGTLTQIQDMVEKPILFVSHKFSPAAQKWCTIKQECFAFFSILLDCSSTY